jgi:hypothetical protein
MAYTYHPFADVFPLLEGDDFAKLLEDIREHGQREPVILYDGKILDGRNRYRACLELGIPPRFDHSKASTDDEALRESVSRNLHRRHLTPTQRALAGARLLPLFEAIAREKSIQSGIDYGRGGKDEVPGPHPLGEREPQARDQAAAAVGAGASSVQRAKKVLTEAPDLVPALEAGHLQIKAAAQLAKEDKPTRDAVTSLLAKGEAKNAAQALRRVKEDQRIEEGRELAAQQTASFVVHCGNILDVLPTIEEPVHCVITDPPYAIETHRTRQGGHDYADGEKYALDLLKHVASDIASNDSIVEGAHLYFFSGYTHLHRFKDALSEFFDVQDNPLIWPKTQHTMCDFSRWWPSKHEYIIFAHKRGARRPLAQCLGDVLPEIGRGRDTEHSAEKPVDLLKILALQSTLEGETILDPFAGSGSTGVAALSCGRRFVGVELSQRWADLARVRCADAL